MGGGAVVSPDGTAAVFEFANTTGKEEVDAQLWIADLSKAAGMSEEETTSHAHLTQLTAGSQHGWTSASSPQWSPCGKYVAFLSDRGGDKTNGTAVYIVPAKGPGEARLLASFPLAVGDLEWNHDAKGLIVSASVYVDEQARGTSGLASMEATAARDKALKDDALGGLNIGAEAPPDAAVGLVADLEDATSVLCAHRRGSNLTIGLFDIQRALRRRPSLCCANSGAFGCVWRLG